MTDPTMFQTTGNTELDNTLNQLQTEINSTNDCCLPDEMVVDAVRRACDFFKIPEVPIVNAQGTCVWPNGTDTYNDDVFGFNRDQLMQLGISGVDSLTLIFTHECAHRALQGNCNDAWEEELACDYFAGIHAGLQGINIDNFESSLGSLPGANTHPNGALRADFIEYGKEIAEEMKTRGIEITFDKCIDRLNEHIKEKENLIAEYRLRFGSNASDFAHEHNIEIHGDPKNATMADVEWAEHQARISSGSEQQHWIERAKWYRDHLGS